VESARREWLFSADLIAGRIASASSFGVLSRLTLIRLAFIINLPPCAVVLLYQSVLRGYTKGARVRD